MKDFRDSLDQLFQFREQSMEKAREAFGEALRSADEITQLARNEIKERVEAMRAYIESEEFERDLDRLAARLKIDVHEYDAHSARLDHRADRVRVKARYLFENARKQIMRSAETGGAFALLSRKSRVVFAITAICGGIKGAEILYECYHVFAPAARRRGLHVV
jgi:hypothetical protein